MTRILVACDAGAAGRELLTRHDVELGWALTVEEAAAWTRVSRPEVVLTREELATQILELSRAPVVVLLEPDGWARRNQYFEAGATALVQATNRQRILEAISHLTGTSFASHARIPYSDVVEVRYGDDSFLCQTADLSMTGMAVHGLENLPIGARIDVSFVMNEPVVHVQGVVVRYGRRQGEPIAGISFSDVDFERAAEIEAIIDRERTSLPDIPEPTGLTTDLAGTFTLDLVTEGGARDRLAQALADDDGTRLPRWLERLASTLTDAERRALLDRRPTFASTALDARIRIAQACVAGEGPSRQDCVAIFELCRSLAEEPGADDETDLPDLPTIRGALLGAVYGTPRVKAGRVGQTGGNPR